MWKRNSLPTNIVTPLMFTSCALCFVSLIMHYVFVITGCATVPFLQLSCVCSSLCPTFHVEKLCCQFWCWIVIFERVVRWLLKFFCCFFWTVCSPLEVWLKLQGWGYISLVIKSTWNLETHENPFLSNKFLPILNYQIKTNSVHR